MIKQQWLWGGIGAVFLALPAQAQGPYPAYVSPPGGFGWIDPRLWGHGHQTITTIYPGVPVPYYAYPPANSPAVLTPPAGWNGGAIVFPDGTPYQPNSAIGPNAVIPARDCWAIPAQPPSAQAPNGFEGVLTLPGGRAWAPGAPINPVWPVWAWMCANWRWRAQMSYVPHR